MALKNLAVQAMPAEASKRVYSTALDHFHDWYFAEPRPPFSNRTVVQQYRTALEKDEYAPPTVNPSCSPSGNEYARRQ